MRDIKRIQRLVGDILPEQLKHVDGAVTDSVGVFMPVAGQCGYATTPEHTHPAWSFIVSFDHQCRTLIDGREYHSIPSTVFVLPPHIPHQELPSHTVSRYIAVLIDPAYLCDQLGHYAAKIDESVSAQTFPVSPRLVDVLKEYVTEYEERSPGHEQLLEAGALKITHLLIRTVLGLSRPNEKVGQRMSISRAIEYFHGHFGEKVSVQDLSYIANLSPSHFSRIFKQETNSSPAEYMLRTRLEYAKRMLRADEKPLTRIALDCGFNSSSYFAQCFLRAYGIPPSEFRKSYTVAGS